MRRFGHEEDEEPDQEKISEDIVLLECNNSLKPHNIEKDVEKRRRGYYNNSILPVVGDNTGSLVFLTSIITTLLLLVLLYLFNSTTSTSSYNNNIGALELDNDLSFSHHLNNNCSGIYVVDQDHYWIKLVMRSLQYLHIPILNTPRKDACAILAIGVNENLAGIVTNLKIPLYLSPWSADRCGNQRQPNCYINGVNEYIRLLSEVMPSSPLEEDEDFEIFATSNNFTYQHYIVPRPGPQSAFKISSTSSKSPQPLIYAKGIQSELPDMNLLKNLSSSIAKYDNATVIRADWDHPEYHFTPEEFANALHHAPFVIAFTPHENLANFLVEIMSTDTPVFLIQNVDYLPLSFDYNAGSCAVSSWGHDAISHRFERFLQNLKTFRPLYASRPFELQCSSLLLLLHFSSDGIVKMRNNSSNPGKIRSNMIAYLKASCNMPIQKVGPCTRDV